MTTPNVEIDPNFLELLKSVVYTFKDSGLTTEAVKQTKQFVQDTKEKLNK